MGLRPVLYWTLDEIAGAGLMRAILVTSPLKPALEAAARTYPGPLELEFVTQQRPRGLGDAFLQARDLLAGSPFAAVLPEFLFRGANPTAAVVQAHQRDGGATALVGAPEGGPAGHARSGAWPATVEPSGAGLRVTDVAVDPAAADGNSGRSSLLGRYVLPDDIFPELDALTRGAQAGNEVDGVAVLRERARRGMLAGVRVESACYEVGLPEGYRSAVADFPARA